MPSTTSSSPVYASAASPAYESYTTSASSSSSSESIIYGTTSSYSPPRKAWVDPKSLANCGDASQIQGNVSPYVKQLILNTFIAYGAGDEHCFGHHVAKAVKFVDISAHESHEKQGRMEATTISEIVVSKNMLNGAGMLHGGCLAFLIDNTPLVALGLIQNINGVGVTQSMNIMFHSPAPVGSCLRIISTSIAMGGRIMSARCEVINKKTGSVVASAYLNKMQPTVSKL
ncbi:HotDog domain-containing protein [Suillus clintonianus]|uniref:HotDog domain-containing protein n=1 Tax=Suillus clintonianus TaxID=1904413 RepID=UPI001B86A73F|nr:HotDog domain-containing protein [Suillus clintonianus]KAG2134115.1 HotDog domain-containing protein [Suillus clintonianus]